MAAFAQFTPVISPCPSFRSAHCSRHSFFRMSLPTPSPRLQEFLSRAEEGSPLLSLSRAEAAFENLKTRSTPPSPFVSRHSTPVRDSSISHYDIIIAGGTLGILYGTALVQKGWRVAVIERGRIAGRTQEWNTSREEMSTLVKNGVITDEELEQVVVTEFEKGRIAFGDLGELWVKGVLNVGVAPDRIVQIAKDKFERLGGVCLELRSIQDVQVAPDAVKVNLTKQKVKVGGAMGAGGSGVSMAEDGKEESITGRVLLDAMGVFSKIADQSRGYRKPDGVCVTVGSCLKGQWKDAQGGDLICSVEGIEDGQQRFWEMFPVDREEDVRTTYMFSYGDWRGRRGLTESLEEYLHKLEMYQGVRVEDMQVKRVLFGFFPSYFKSGPTKVQFDRIVPVGDAGGLQSPISFGGFACCLRHLERITLAMDEALQVQSDEMLSKSKLQMLQSYSPSLAVSGLFHTAMAVKPGQTRAGPLLDEQGINDVLWSNMNAMAQLGEDVQRPFLQDVVTADGLSKTLAKMTITDPVLALRMTAFLGPAEILGWARHYIALLGYAAALPLLERMRDRAAKREKVSPERMFWWNRVVDAAMFGSGSDATLQH